MARKAAKKAAKAERPEKAPDRGEQVREVIAKIEGGMSENAACADVGINRATFRAAALREGVGDEYARALASLAQDQVERMEATIQDMREGVIDPQVARIELDNRRWFASKFLPRLYGDKVQTEHSGAVTIERRVFPAEAE